MADGIITNYGELKAEVKKYLWDRKLLINQIPGFISLAERKIFRRLRVPAHEKLLDYDPPDGDVPYSQLELPGDFLELKFLLRDDQPLQRVSDIKIKAMLNARPAAGLPEMFARIGNRLYLYPTPDSVKYTFSMSYWQDLSNTLQEDEDSHEVLRVAPDLYVFGACAEAAPYLVEDSRIAVWKSLFEEAMLGLENQYKEAEYAGSNVQVSAAGGGLYGDRNYRGYF